jgi:hypothetical protein
MILAFFNAGNVVRRLLGTKNSEVFWRHETLEIEVESGICQDEGDRVRNGIRRL